MYEQVSANKRKTFGLLMVFFLLVAAMAVVVTYLLGTGPYGPIFALGFALVMSLGSYFQSDKIALALSGARAADSVEFQRLHNIVEGLCIASGIPKPKVYVVNDPAPNAFATGRNPKHASIAVTTGLLEIMNRVELEGVIAHELSHIKNYDILVSTIAVTAVGAVAILSDFARWGMIFGGGKDRDRGNNPLSAVVAIVGIVFIIFAPIAAQLMQFAVSRKRELLADASGVLMTRYPPGLIAALEKLKNDRAIIRNGARSTAQLWIETPLDTRPEAKGNWLNKAFATHPPLDERIKILQEM